MVESLLRLGKFGSAGRSTTFGVILADPPGHTKT